MLAALDRIHQLVTLNEPHQFFVANVMKERNFWQQMAKKVRPEDRPSYLHLTGR